MKEFWTLFTGPASLPTVIARFATDEVTEEEMKKLVSRDVLGLDYDFTLSTLSIFSSVEEFFQGHQKKLVSKALAKLTSEEIRALGLTKL